MHDCTSWDPPGDRSMMAQLVHDGDGGLEVVALVLRVVHLDGDALGSLALQVRQLLPQHRAAVARVGGVVGEVGLHVVGRRLVRHDVAPALVVVHAQRHQEVVDRES